MVINGVGEPLLNPNFCEILSIAKRSGVADFVEFFTNGTLLTPQLSKDIAQTGVDRVKISLQGLNDEKYKQVCGKNISYKETIKSLVKRDLKICLLTIEIYNKLQDLVQN